MSSPPSIDLHELSTIMAATEPRKLLYLVLLLAAKDGASEVRFERITPAEVIDLGFSLPSGEENGALPPGEEWQGCRIRYRIGGVFFDMVPAPCAVSDVAREAAALSGIGPLRRWLGETLTQTREHRLRILIGGKPLEILARLPRAGSPADEALVLYLLEPAAVVAEAGEVLSAYVSEWEAGEAAKDG